MHKDNLSRWHHEHTFSQDERKPGESRTLIVIAITATMMVVEIVSGLIFGSMALLADGLHMASHTVALGLTAFAYSYGRRNSRNRSFSFGTGKVNVLGGYTGAILLAVFAVHMAIEGVVRLVEPVQIIFNQAIAVAILGLIVNGASVIILGADEHGHEHHHDHGHDTHEHHDHNLTAAYFHVLADALISVLAIVALLTAKFFHWIWMDPMVGIIGAVLVARWSYGLLASTASVLLDRQASEQMRNAIVEAIENDGDSRVTDLHVWSIGPDIFSAQIALVAHEPASPETYKRRIEELVHLDHVTVETHLCGRHEQFA